MTIVVVAFWLWVAVSCVLFVRRRMTGSGRRSTPEPAQGAALRAAESQIPTGPEAADSARVAAAVGPDSAASAVAVDRPPLEDQAAEPRAATLADALGGLMMPCDLAPLTQRVADAFDPGRVTLATDAAPADAVVSELAAELRRIGYEAQVQDLRIRADRGQAAVTATVTERVGEGPTPTVVVELVLA